jgi:hypothetical protein
MNIYLKVEIHIKNMYETEIDINESIATSNQHMRSHYNLQVYMYICV